MTRINTDNLLVLCFLFTHTSCTNNKLQISVLFLSLIEQSFADGRVPAISEKTGRNRIFFHTFFSEYGCIQTCVITAQTRRLHASISAWGVCERYADLGHALKNREAFLPRGSQTGEVPHTGKDNGCQTLQHNDIKLFPSPLDMLLTSLCLIIYES